MRYSRKVRLVGALQALLEPLWRLGAALALLLGAPVQRAGAQRNVSAGQQVTDTFTLTAGNA